VRKVRVEDYLIAIDHICEDAEVELAKSGQIAKALGIANGTASTTLLTLAADGLIIHQPYEGARLTDLGRARARQVVRRLRIIEVLLGNLLGWERELVSNEARQLELVVSERLVDSLDSYLNFPESDRYGQTIPRAVMPLIHPKSNPTIPAE
jgi:DtxR family Mn-dependent transcriptional regulator